MKSQGIPNEPDVMKADILREHMVKTAKDAVFRTSMSAIEQLEMWKTYAVHWCEHKPSVTISVKEQEWVNAGVGITLIIYQVCHLPFRITRTSKHRIKILMRSSIRITQ